MKKVIKLKESEIINIVKKLLSESSSEASQPEPPLGLQDDVETPSVTNTKITYQSVLACYKKHTKVGQFPNGFSTPTECRTEPESESCKRTISNQINMLKSISPNNVPDFKNCLNNLYGSNTF